MSTVPELKPFFANEIREAFVNEITPPQQNAKSTEDISVTMQKRIESKKMKKITAATKKS